MTPQWNGGNIPRTPTAARQPPPSTPRTPVTSPTRAGVHTAPRLVVGHTVAPAVSLAALARATPGTRAVQGSEDDDEQGLGALDVIVDLPLSSVTGGRLGTDFGPAGIDVEGVSGRADEALRRGTSLSSRFVAY